MNWLPVTLLCAFSLASADALTKKYLADYSARELVLVRFGFGGLLLAPFLFTYPPTAAPLAFWAWVGAAIPLEILAMLLYMRAIRDSPLALTLPYLAFTPVFTALTGWLLLGETLSWRGLAGVLAVVVGAYLLNLNPAADSGSGRGRWLAPLRAIGRERGSRLMLAVAALYSVTSVCGKGALKYIEPQAFGALYYAVLSVITLGLFAFRPTLRVDVLWRRPGWHLLIGLLTVVMVLTHFAAIAQVNVAYMIAVKRTSLLFGMVYGAVWFGERHLGRHLLAGAWMIAGVALVAG